MFTAKDIVIKPVAASVATNIVRLFHYSGKATQNSQVHFGVFLNGTIQGALQFGPSIDKRRMANNLGIGFNEFLELNRMALSDACPKNSESRALGVCLRMLRKKYPHLKLIVSFADATQCGDGIIYRASGFKLHSFKKNTSLLQLENGEISFNHGTKKRPTVIAKKSLDNKLDANGKYASASASASALPGFQMKYLYFFDKELEKKFSFVDFKDIPAEVKMYKGQRVVSVGSGTSSDQGEGGGESPTTAHHLAKKQVADCGNTQF